MIKSENDIVKIRSKVLVFKDGESFLVCKGCGVELPVPIEFNADGFMKTRNPKLFICNNSK